MKKLWQVIVTTIAEAEEASIETFASVFGVPATCYLVDSPKNKSESGLTSAATH